ncbi:MAG: isochorismatase family protein [Bacteroidales bacterium]|nr:isochorismatase family protein [Bacteroidales bacterium]
MKKFWTILAIVVAAAIIACLVFCPKKGKKAAEEPKAVSAIVVVDELYDFIDGSLACHRSDTCVANSAALLAEAAKDPSYPIIFVCDHHPANHCSFAEQGGPWPPHCVQGTRGGEIADELKQYVKAEYTFNKGEDPALEQYSGFEGRNSAGQTLDEMLKSLGVQEVTVIGIATEFCVRNTAEDLMKAGYKVTIPEDCLACVDYQGHVEAIEAMKAEGITIK